ncbi:MAG: hypothetical protein ACK4TP_07965 [Hyphomicrobium sp.]
MIDASRALAGLPKGLRGELLAAYQDIMSNYLERRWEPAELNGGKFCEVVYSIVNGVLTGTMPAKASKPANMLTACRALENVSPDANRVGDRSLRIMIPRLLPVLYEVRNNRGVGHVGGDVVPNHMDAEAVQAMASWVMAELVRIFHGISVDEAKETVDALVERKTPLIWEVGGLKRVLNPELGAKDQVLLFLHHSTGWVAVDDLFKWVEYSNASMFRSAVLKPLHKLRLIEYDADQARARISPKGSKDVEDRLLGQ